MEPDAIKSTTMSGACENGEQLQLQTHASLGAVRDAKLEPHVSSHTKMQKFPWDDSDEDDDEDHGAKADFRRRQGRRTG